MKAIFNENFNTCTYKVEIGQNTFAHLQKIGEHDHDNTGEFLCFSFRILGYERSGRRVRHTLNLRQLRRVRKAQAHLRRRFSHA